MNSLYQYVTNEIVKLIRNRSIGLTMLVIPLLSVAYSYQFSSNLAHRSDLTVQTIALNSVSLFQFYLILIFPLTGFLFIWSVEVEEDGKAFNGLRIGTLSPTLLKAAKFLVAYAGTLLLNGFAFGLLYAVYSSAMTDVHPAAAYSIAIKHAFVNTSIHFILLPLPFYLTVFLVSFYARLFYVSVAALVLLHLIGVLLFVEWAAPFRALIKAIGIEAVIARGWTSYTRQDLKSPYQLSLLYVFVLLSIDALSQKFIVNRFFRHAA